MIWTDKGDLVPIMDVTDAIVADAFGLALRNGSIYQAIAPQLFGGAPLTVAASAKPASDLSAIEGSCGSIGVLLRVGAYRGNAALKDAVRITLAGALCQELVHKRQRARDTLSYDVTAAVQAEWHRSRPSQPTPEEWLIGYYGTVHEFEAHAEQIAYEVWMADRIAGTAQRRSVSVATLTNSEPLTRIRARLSPGGTTSALAQGWYAALEGKVNDALVGW
jgi:hypothetical protein